jgi:hypothetical protein
MTAEATVGYTTPHLLRGQAGNNNLTEGPMAGNGGFSPRVSRSAKHAGLGP